MEPKLTGPGLEEQIWAVVVADPAKALNLALVASERERQFDLRFMQWLVSRDEPDEPADRTALLACLNLLPQFADETRIRRGLVRLAGSRDMYIRSKAAALLVRGQSLVWLENNLPGMDPRSRANAIESSFDFPSSYALRALYRNWISDPDNRVAGNALLGLHKSGDTFCIPCIFRMAAHPNPRFRATACWVMGRSEDPRFLETLECIAKAETGNVRANAVRAIRTMKAAMQRMSAAPTGSLLFGPVQHEAGGHVRYDVIVRDSEDHSMNALNPVAFVPRQDGHPIPDFHLFVRNKSYPHNAPVPAAFAEEIERSGTFYELEHQGDWSSGGLSLEIFSSQVQAHAVVPGNGSV